MSLLSISNPITVDFLNQHKFVNGIIKGFNMMSISTKFEVFDFDDNKYYREILIKVETLMDYYFHSRSLLEFDIESKCMNLYCADPVLGKGYKSPIISKVLEDESDFHMFINHIEQTSFVGPYSIYDAIIKS